MLVRDSAVRCYHHELDGVSFCMLLAGEKRLDFVSQNTFIVLVNDEFMLQKYEFISMIQKNQPFLKKKSKTADFYEIK